MKIEKIYKNHFFPSSCVLCEDCKKDVKLDNTWRVLTRPYNGNCKTVRHLCYGCAGTKDDAEKYFDKKEYEPKKPDIKIPGFYRR